tara:strand:- start:1670 stop:2683 length:1014 start_codon:yes stop_codon:yes gene_type:complete
MANVAAKGSSFATYSGANLNQLFFEPVFKSDEIMRNYRVIPNVKHKMNVYTSASLKKIVQAYTTCSSSSTSDSFNIEQKTITAGRMRVALEQCSNEFHGTYIEELYKNGVDVRNLEGTMVADAILNRTVSGIGSDVVRLAWGGDGSTSDYDQMTGWMKLMGDDTTVETAKRAVTAADSDNPTSAEAIATIRKAFDNAPAALQQVPAGDKKLFVTPKIYNAYLANLEGTSADLAYQAQVSGAPRVAFRGVEVVPMYEWDTILADTNPAMFTISATNYTQGVCYCAVENLAIGSDVNDPESSFKIFYDDLEEKMFVRGYFKLGVQFMFPSLVQWCIIKQ